MGDAIWITMIQGKCQGTIQLRSIIKPFGHRPFCILTNSSNPGGEVWPKPTLRRLDPTVKTAAGNKCSWSPTPTGDVEQPGSWMVWELPVGAGNRCAEREAVQQGQAEARWSHLSVGSQGALGRSSPCYESVKRGSLWEGLQTCQESRTCRCSLGKWQKWSCLGLTMHRISSAWNTVATLAKISVQFHLLKVWSILPCC